MIGEGGAVSQQLLILKLELFFSISKIKKKLAHHEILPSAVYLFGLGLTGSCQQEMLLPLLVNPSCSPSGSVWETSVNPTISLSVSFSTHSEDMNTDSSQHTGEFPGCNQVVTITFIDIITFIQTCCLMKREKGGFFPPTKWNLSHDLNLLNKRKLKEEPTKKLERNQLFFYLFSNFSNEEDFSYHVVKIVLLTVKFQFNVFSSLHF